MSDAFAHCERLVREVDKDRFLAALFAPEERRPALLALYAFDIEVARVPTMAKQAIAGEIRLQWWREVLQGQRDDEARANPVAAALIETMDKYRLARTTLVDLADARTFDLYSDPFATITELEAYAEASRAPVTMCAAAILGIIGTKVPTAARHAAIATVICDLLRSFPSRVSRGHLHVPLDVLNRQGVQPADVFAGHSSDGLLVTLAKMRGLARDHVRAFKELVPAVPAAAVPAFLPAAVIPLYLDRMEAKGYQPFHTAIEIPQWRRQWALWRAARTWGAR
jgi:phytoene synthase